LVNIKELRKKAGLTQEGLANKAGLSQQVVQQIESGKTKNPTYETMQKLMSALETDKPKKQPKPKAKRKPSAPKPENRKKQLESIRKLF
jgi:transcriptional regulator with XRE-family HTH domain